MGFKNAKNTIVTHSTTVTVNGKVVSPDDPYVKQQMEKMQNKFGKYLGNDYMENMMKASEASSDPEDSQDEMADMPGMEDFEGFGEAFFTSNQPQQTTVVQCKNCGAKNSVTSGEFMACEYCGSGLEF